jgi:uncharacterized protein (DUF2252 family)
MLPRQERESEMPKSRKDKTKLSAGTSPVLAATQASAADRLAAGNALRDKVPRQVHGRWKRDSARVDPLAILRASDKVRIPRLLPVRYGRMLQSPFTFYRGSAAVMAADLAGTPSTGIRVQACGDCHLLNFGGFATPERNILFDINDFDETLPAPWEWDVKRLAASFVLAARSNKLSDAAGRDAAVACAASYREHLREYSKISPLERWYARITSFDLMEMLPSKQLKKRVERRIAKATSGGGSDLVFPEITEMVGGKIGVREDPPLIFHPGPEEIGAEDFQALVRYSLKAYRKSLAEDRRLLLDRYRLVDGAVKVVGIGSVGTACVVILLMSPSNKPLFLQVKEAWPSVLEPYAGKSAYTHHGQRVVMGQRLMQPATDVFLGWATGKLGRQFYVRQLRDAKIKPLVETFDAEVLTVHAKACGWALARAHAKGGDPTTISGYLGTKESFDKAMGTFALAYADQAERDHAALKAAVRAGKIEVLTDA